MPDPSPGASQPTIACPFCGLGCDDLSPVWSNGGYSVDSHGCPLAAERFATALAVPTAAPRCAGQTASLDAALTRAASLLRQARLPLFAGLSGDLVDMRGVLRLAERTGGCIDHRNGAALMCNQSVLEECGWMVTSQGEVRNRADLLVLVGSGLSERFPRLLERLKGSGERLHTQAPMHLIHIAADLPTQDQEGDHIQVQAGQLRDFIGVLRARLAGRTLNTGAFPEAAVLAQRLSAASYPVIAFSAAGLSSEPHADLLVRSLASLVRELNAEGRAALLPLGGADGETSAQQVSAWHTGFGVRQSFHTGQPQYQPHAGATERLLTSGGADLLVWISSLSDAPPPLNEVPTLVFGHPAMRLEREPEVFVPMAIPGVHRAGAVHRGDGLALLPLAAIADHDLPESAEVFARLLSLLSEESPPC